MLSLLLCRSILTHLRLLIIERGRSAISRRRSRAMLYRRRLEIAVRRRLEETSAERQRNLDDRQPRLLKG